MPFRSMAITVLATFVINLKTLLSAIPKVLLISLSKSFRMMTVLIATNVTPVTSIFTSVKIGL